MVRHLLGEQGSPSAALPPGSAVASPPEEAPSVLGARDLARARQIGWVVRTAATRTPWRSDCFAQALTARLLLRTAGVPHLVTFGLRRDESGALRAHVWVGADHVAVTGGTGARWTGVGSFAWTPRRP